MSGVRSFEVTYQTDEGNLIRLDENLMESELTEVLVVGPAPHSDSHVSREPTTAVSARPR